jgi:hypothetical protein
MKRKKAVILNSRQGLHPVGNDPWIKSSIRAVRDAISNGCILLTSMGMNTWELILFLASRYKANQKIFIPVEKNSNRANSIYHCSRQFRITKRLTAWHSFEGQASGKNKEEFNRFRDKQIVREADVIYPVSIRPCGNLDNLLKEALNHGGHVRDDFRVEYSGRHRTSRLQIDDGRINPVVDRKLRRFIIHWTRSFSGPWPGETHYDYYNDVVRSTSQYPRSGFDTLKRIIAEETLIASPTHYRSGISAVAFSSHCPSEAVTLMKWRARYRRMTFEPYGIAIDNAFAGRIGIKKVFYGNPEMYHYLDEEEKPYFQSLGTRGDWQPEMEYRHIGNINLSIIPSEYIAVIVWKAEEIGELSRYFKGKIVSLYR